MIEFVAIKDSLLCRVKYKFNNKEKRFLRK